MPTTDDRPSHDDHDDRLSDDLIWAVTGIAAYIGRTIRQTYHLLERGLIPATKVGNAWVARRSELDAFFRAHPDAATDTSPTTEAPESERGRTPPRKPPSPRGRR